MKSIHRYYDHVAEELKPTPAGVALPSRIHAIVPISQLNEPTLRALAFARATRPNTLTAVVVEVNPEATAALVEARNNRQIPVPLAVIDSPYREFTTPLLSYIERSAVKVHATSCASSFPSTSSPTGGNNCSTTKARSDEGTTAVHAGRHGDQRAVPPEPVTSVNPGRLDRPTQTRLLARGTKRLEPQPSHTCGGRSSSRSSSSLASS